MNKNLVGSMYVINIIAQSIFTLLTPPAVLFFINYLLVSNFGIPTWSYAISLSVGFIFGIVSMIKFAIAASEGLERLEKQNNKKD